MKTLRDQIAEEKVWEFLTNDSGYTKVEDLRGTDDEKKGLTFAGFRRNGRRVTFCVKGDNHTTGNFFYETIRDVETNKKSIFETSKADFILYHFVHCDILYQFKTKELRNFFRNNQIRFDEQDYYLKKSGRNIEYCRTIQVPLTNGPEVSKKIGYVIPLTAVHDKKWTIVYHLTNKNGNERPSIKHVMNEMNRYNQSRKKPLIYTKKTENRKPLPRKKHQRFSFR